MANNVLINNLCNWDLYFRRATGMGDVKIPANAKNFPLLSFEEVQAQIQLGNVMFAGTDGMGGHARIQIVDEAQRNTLFGIENHAAEPVVLTQEAVKELLAIKSKAKFNDKLSQLVKTNAEKKMLVKIAFDVGAEEAESWKVDALRKLGETAEL